MNRFHLVMLGLLSCVSGHALTIAPGMAHNHLEATPAPLQNVLPPPNAWANAQRLHQFDLYSLYPAQSRNCKLSAIAQALSPDSRILAISSHDYERTCGSGTSTLSLWDLQTGKKMTTLMQGKATEAFFLEGKAAQEPIAGNTNIAGDIAHAIEFSPNNPHLIAGMSNGTVKVWDIATKQVKQTLSGHRYAVHALALKPDGQMLASGSSDQTVKLWHLPSGKLLRTLQLKASNGIVDRVLMSADGQILVSATTTNQIQLWNTETGQLIRTIRDGDQDASLRQAVVLSPTRTLMANSDRDHSIKLWNTRTGTRWITLRGHRAAIQSLAFSPNGKTLVSSSADGTVKFWNLQTHQLERTLSNVGVTNQFNHSPVGRIALSPNGDTIAIEAFMPSQDSIPRLGIKLWDVRTQRFVISVPELFSPTGVRFSPNGKLLTIVAPKTIIWQRSN